MRGRDRETIFLRTSAAREAPLRNSPRNGTHRLDICCEVAVLFFEGLPDKGLKKFLLGHIRVDHRNIQQFALSRIKTEAHCIFLRPRLGTTPMRRKVWLWD